MAKILIIEDEDSIRRLITYDLKQASYEVDGSADGQEGYDMALKGDYDVIIIDWMLPGLSGIEIVKELRQNYIDSILIMLTAKDEEEDILDAFEAGVDDYITKPFSARQLNARIKAHLKRFEPKQENILIVGNLKIDKDRYQTYINDEEIHLTKKEYDLLVYLVENLEHVVSREQILNDIWNFDYDGDTRIVDVHIFKLRSKLANASSEIKSLRGVGYVFKEK